VKPELDGVTVANAPVDYTTDELVERVVVWVQNIVGAQEFIRAKDDFYLLFGKVFPEDAFYEARMNYFLEYFVFVRPITEAVNPAHAGKTPFVLFRESEAAVVQVPDNERGVTHSLFQVVRHRKDSMVVRDLMTGTKHKIVPRHSETFCGFGKSDIFQGFVFSTGDLSHVSHGVVIHPRKVESIIKKTIKNVKKSLPDRSESLLRELAHLQIRAARHSHVNPKLIYNAPAR